MELFSRTCPVCGSTRANALEQFRGGRVLQCRACGLARARHTPTPEQLEDYYRDYPVRDVLSPITALRYDELLDEFEAYRTTGRILDVGCGAGLFLERAKARGWEAHGTEYGERAVKACRDRGIRIMPGALEPDNYREAPFDVVTSFEVMEHLVDPAADARRMAQVLRPGGLLYVTTPNFNSVSRWLAGPGWTIVAHPEHPSLFTPRAMRHMLRDAGLRERSVRTTGISVSRLQRSRKGPAPKAGGSVARPPDADEQLRRRLEGNLALRMAKGLLNGLLDLLKRGDTIKARFVKPV